MSEFKEFEGMEGKEVVENSEQKTLRVEIKEVTMYDVYVDGIKVFPNPVPKRIAERAAAHYRST